MRRFCAALSRAINCLFGGKPNQTLCARIAAHWGHDCLFCRAVGAVLRESDHCWRERVVDMRRR